MPNRRQAIIWTNAGLDYRNIYVSLGLDELATVKQNKFGPYIYFL